LIWTTSLTINNSWTWGESDPIPVELDLTKNYHVEVKYSEDSPPSGNAYVKLVYSFPDQCPHTLYHTFNCYDRDPWITNPAELYSITPVYFEGNIFDPGMDDINGIIQLKTDIHFEIDFFLAFLLDILGCFPFSYEFALTESSSVKVEGWMTPEDIIHITIEGTTNLTEIAYENDGTWPVTIPLSLTSRIPDLDFLGVIDLVNIEIFGCTLLDIDVTQSDCRIEAFIEDDDGGICHTTVDLIRSGQLGTPNLAPRLKISSPTQIIEDMPVQFQCIAHSAYSPDSLQYIWDFGDGTTMTGEIVSHTYEYSGNYLVQLTVIDPQSISTTQGFVLTVDNFVPVVEVLGVFEGEEDAELTFETNIYETVSDEDSLRYFWTFGDGSVGTGSEVTHAYARSDSYSLNVYVTDDNGAIGTYSALVTINDAPPVVDGPFGYTSVEGLTLIAEPMIYDSTVDEPEITFQWEYGSMTSSSYIFTTSEDDGTYEATLTVTDPDAVSLSYPITFSFLNAPPVATASSYILYGPPQELDLKAYGIDSFVDTQDLTYKWFIDEEEVPDGQGLSSSISHLFQQTRTYNGYIAVTDETYITVYRNFTVVAVIDSDGDGLTDEVEAFYGTSSNSSDSDGDYLPDQYEIEESNTNPNAADSDNDGLLDGLDDTPGVLTGEIILGTDPWNPDSDADGLLDGVEVIGWPITVNGETYTAHSNPLKIDTDGDGLTDLYEMENHFDPEKPDTDGDGRGDFEQSGSTTEVDTDGDGLNDNLGKFYHGGIGRIRHILKVIYARPIKI